MDRQTQIPVPPMPEVRHPCAWCGAPSYRDFELEPARKTTAKGSVGIIPAKTAPICARCYDRLAGHAA